MAGAFLSIDVDERKVVDALSRLAAFDGEAMPLALEQIGEYLLRSTRDRAELQIDPEGDPWAPLSPRYAKWKEKKRPGVPILKFDFHMLGDQLSWQIVGDELFVGTNAVYGATHQFGREVTLPDGTRAFIPARPYLGLSDEDAEEVTAILVDHLERAIGPASGPTA